MATILVVDDEPGIRDVLAFFLMSEGYNVIEASNGVEAFTVLLSEDVDLVLSDLKMPKCNGIELLKKIETELDGYPRVILMTGYLDEPFDSYATKTAVSIHHKPVDRNELFDDIRSVLAQTMVSRSAN